MTSATSLCILVVLFGCMIFYYVGADGRKLSRIDEGIDMQPGFLNKPHVKTIKTGFKNVYDCVDFYKQPAFNHPLLRNHSYHPQMRPSFSPTMATSKFADNYKLGIKSPRLRLDCPKGTVPIKRVTKDDLIRIKSLMQQLASRTTTSSSIHAERGASQPYLAVAQSITTANPPKFKGVGGTLSIYNPSLGSSQYSSGEVIIQNGADSIRAGWTVNPTINNDIETHSFAYFKAGNVNCFNTLCPGFVAVNNHIPVDQVYQHKSTRGGDIYADRYFIYQDNDNWWLNFGDEHIGFWPKNIFSTLQDTGNYIACGGEVFSPDGQKVPMGSGVKPEDNTNEDGFCAYFIAVDDAQNIGPAQNLETYTDDSLSYKVIDDGMTNLGQLVLYGGPL